MRDTFLRRKTSLICSLFFNLNPFTFVSSQPTMSAAASVLRLWVRIPPGSWMSVWCVCCVLSGRGLCDELIMRPEESYRLLCVVVCDLVTS
jgi:hypothetical protein